MKQSEFIDTALKPHGTLIIAINLTQFKHRS